MIQAINLQVKKRDGKKATFDSSKIRIAITKAFVANNISDENLFGILTTKVLQKIEAKYSESVTVEQIQDIVEEVIIENNYPHVAKSYILYREKHKEIREKKVLEAIKEHKLLITKEDGTTEPFDIAKVKEKLTKISGNLKNVSISEITEEISKTVYNGIQIGEIDKSIINAVKSKIEVHYDYSYLASRFLLNLLYKDILKTPIYDKESKQNYQKQFSKYIGLGVEQEILSPELKKFDLEKISAAITQERDKLFLFLGIQTIYDRYLLKTRTHKRIFELPQWMWMRVAMGLAIKEKNKEEKAIEFYNALSQMYLVSSTPTLFNSGTTHSQMSSCYINTVDDSITGIFKTYSDCAQLSKWAGGIGTDWTNVRAKSAKIFGTNGESQGTIPFIKIFNDVALAVNQGGKRRGAMAAYLEVWHRDVEEFLDLKKNTGDERRRAHDIHTAVWIPDLFMKRVREKGEWTLFSPDTVPELHSSYGKKFEELYLKYEKQDLIATKKMQAIDLWRKILTALYENGHPWICYKDAINVRNSQDHKGVVYSSNLCTEITLNTSSGETAVCNLASINLSKMIKDGKLNEEIIQQTTSTAMNMLDNVIDINFYPIPEAKESNMKHRPVGLGIMGYQDALYQLKIDFDSEENLEFADASTEMISYYAIKASSELARVRGPYESYESSKWDRGILPIDSLDMLEKQRGVELKVSKTKRLQWDKLRSQIKKFGMRNSNCMAIAPTATISNIAGTTPTVEPTYKNLYMKENLSGNFVVVNSYLVDELNKIDLWNEDIITKIKINDGSVLNIDEIPADIRRRFKEAFEIESSWIIKAAGLRAKWIDQSASTNIFIKTTSGKQISDLYMLAWETGLKTTYYLRTLAASQVTKTVGLRTELASEDLVGIEVSKPSQLGKKFEIKTCAIDNPDCESCQ